MGFEGLGDSMRSSAVLFKKRARAKEEGRSRSHSMYPLFFMSYPPPETAHSLILKPKSKRRVKHENPEKFNPFVTAAAAHRKLDRRRDDLCAAGLRKRVVS